MIDEKKIEEAAEKHMLEQFHSDDDWGFPCDTSDIKSQCINDFKAGINWLLENLWHNVNEPAKELYDLVYVDTNKEVWSTECYESDDYEDNFSSGWGAYVRNTNLVKWAYKKDLLPFLFKK